MANIYIILEKYFYYFCKMVSMGVVYVRIVKTIVNFPTDCWHTGPGSTLLFTIEAMAGLQSVITEIKTQLGKDRIRMLDIPCGDMRWMPRFLETREDVDYTGMDIVPVTKIKSLNINCIA